MQFKGIPKCLFGQVVVWRPGANKKCLSFEKSVCLALPPKVARPKKHDFQENVWFFGLGTPGLQKNTCQTNHFGIPLVQYDSTLEMPSDRE